MEYLAIIYNNTDVPSSEREWDDFFILAKESGFFLGGSQVGNNRQIIGKGIESTFGTNIGGYMKFKCNNIGQITKLLNSHPVIINGGSIELIDLPKD